MKLMAKNEVIVERPFFSGLGGPRPADLIGLDAQDVQKILLHMDTVVGAAYVREYFELLSLRFGPTPQSPSEVQKQKGSNND